MCKGFKFFFFKTEQFLFFVWFYFFLIRKLATTNYRHELLIIIMEYDKLHFNYPKFTDSFEPRPENSDRCQKMGGGGGEGGSCRILSSKHLSPV